MIGRLLRRARPTADAAALVARLTSFAAVGASGFVLDVVCYLALQWLGLDHRIARAAAFWPAVTWNWFGNRRLTFAERPLESRSSQWARFVASSLAGLALNAGSYASLTSFVAFFDAHRWLALLLGVALGGVANFALAARYVYRPAGPANGAHRMEEI